VGPQTLPDHLVNYATLTEPEARDLLARAQAALLYDRDQQVDLVPEPGITLRSLDGLSRDERFQVRWVPPEQGGGYALFDAWAARGGQTGRLDDPQTPVQRLWGLPTGRPGRPGRTLTPFDPLVAEFGGLMFAIRYVTLRVRDPLDPSRATATAEIVTGTPISLDALLPDPRSTYRMALTYRLGAESKQDPRLVFLPITPAGQLDAERDGVVVRLAVTSTRIEPWTRQLDEAVLPVAVRLHVGTRDSLKAMLDARPPPPRALFDEPGSPTDPLLMGPRAHGAPLGAGVQVMSGLDGVLTVLQPFGGGPTSGNLQPDWPGVTLESWYGRGVLGAVAAPELLALQLGGRVGSLRDTDSTVILAEVGVTPRSYSRFATPLSAAVVVRARRQTGNTFLDRTIEVGNDIRVGTNGVGYRALVGLRLYLGSGMVLTPTASGGLRYDLNRRTGEGFIGLSADLAWNRNVFTRPKSASAAAPARPADPADRAADPPAR